MASDERLVEHVRDGSEAAFEQVYDRHHRGILGFCRHMLGSAEEAEDAVQHTFMAAYRDLVGSDKPIQLRPWLYTIARNRCYSTLRARRERPLGEADEPATEHLSSEVQRRQDLRDLLSDLSGLPDDQRAALVLAELGAVSHEEIATVLDVPREKVKALVFQARTSLMASRQARDTPCLEIREQLASLRGGSLRRTTLRRHLRECPGCRAFRNEVMMQRRALAVALPVLPTLGLKHAALAAAFGSGSAGGGAAAVAVGAGAATGAAASSAAGGGSALAAKALVAAVLVGGGTTAGVTAIQHSPSHHRPPARIAHDVRAGTRTASPPSTVPSTPRVSAVTVAGEHRHGGPSTAMHVPSPTRAQRQTAAAKRKHDAAALHRKHAASQHHRTGSNGAGNGERQNAGSKRGNGHSGTGNSGKAGNGNGKRDTDGTRHVRPVQTPAPQVVKQHGNSGKGNATPAPVPTATPAPVVTAPTPVPVPTTAPTDGSSGSGHGNGQGNSGEKQK
jgi:RNA polymerase sigma factor (sigma-70 family)